MNALSDDTNEDLQPKVEIGPNSMSASLILPAEFDRAQLTPDLCEGLLRAAGIFHEIIVPEKIQAYIAKAQEAPDGQYKAVIAEAIPPKHGEDAYVEWLVGIDKEKQEKTPEPEEVLCQDEPTPDPTGSTEEETEEESISFYSQSSFIVVKSGDVLGQVHQEVLGDDGIDVTGKSIASRTAKPLEFKYDESIAINKYYKLIAQADGVLIRDKNTAHISDTIIVDQNVDFSTGNIDFPGSVVVNRGVKDCFVIKATDNVEVRGLIEAATIVAGKNLYAKGGFAGRDQGRAEVEGNLEGKYLDAVKTQIGGDLMIDREVINCSNTVLGNIVCPRGSIIGGCTLVSGSVELMELGASAQPITEIHVGVLPMLDPLITELEQFIEDLIEQRDELLSEQEMITKNSGTRIAPAHQAKLDEINMKMGAIQIELDRAEPSLERVRERAESRRKIDVTILRKLHPNAVLVSGGFRYRITNELKGPLRIRANKRGQLEYQHGDSPAKLLSSESDLRTAA